MNENSRTVDLPLANEEIVSDDDDAASDMSTEEYAPNAEELTVPPHEETSNMQIASSLQDNPVKVDTQKSSDQAKHEAQLKPHLEESKAQTSSHDRSLDDDGQLCTICFEHWTNTSEHRLVSLRCGHLFGRSCITRWLKGQNSRCPQCNARARKSEIRNIYAKAIKVLDTSERDKALKDLEKERELRLKCEIEAAQERVKYMLAVQECELLKKDLIETKRLLQEARTGLKLNEMSSQPLKSKASVFMLDKIIDISKIGGCRLSDVCDLLGMVIVSQPSINDLFPGFGFRKISTLDMRPAEFVWVHQKPIKDMAFHSHEGLVLTASLDKSVKITNVLTNSVVQTYPLESDAWSCAWDTDDPTYFFAGVKNGGVFLFDIRVTDRYLHQLPRLGQNAPVVSLQYLRKIASVSHSKCGPIVGKLSNCGFYQKLGNIGAYRVDALPLSGLFTSLSSEPLTGHVLVSCRPSNKHPKVTHTLCELVSEDSEECLMCRPIQTLTGGSTQVQLTRSKLLTHPERESSLLVCAGDEDAHGALIWDSSTGKCIDTLRTDSPVLDIMGLRLSHKFFLTSLTDKNLRLYRWTG